MFLPFTETARKILLLEGVPEEKVEVVYPGVDLERFKPGPKPEDLLTQNNIPQNSFVILYVGKLVSWKGVHNLVYTARVLKEKGVKDFVVAVAGKGAQKENMARLIRETNTESHFRFLDFVSYDEMPDVHRMADVFVLPSYPTMTWQEQFGMVLIEAMACGKPVISTNSGSIPEVIGDAGILISPGNFFQLAEIILNLMSNRGFALEVGNRGRQRVETYFDAQKNAMKFYEVVKAL